MEPIDCLTVFYNIEEILNSPCSRRDNRLKTDSSLRPSFMSTNQDLTPKLITFSASPRNVNFTQSVRIVWLALVRKLRLTEPFCLSLGRLPCLKQRILLINFLSLPPFFLPLEIFLFYSSYSILSGRWDTAPFMSC